MTYGLMTDTDLRVARNREKPRTSPTQAIMSKLRMRRLWVQTENQARTLAEDALVGLKLAGYRIIHEDDIGKAVDRGW